MRAYLAGFGTSGSLLAVAALLFVVASALVAFNGWPHLGAQPSPGRVVISASPSSAASSPSARRLVLVSARVPAGRRLHAAPVAAGRRGSGPGPTVRIGQGVPEPVLPVLTRPAPGSGAPASTPAPYTAPASGAPSRVSGTVPKPPVPIPSVPPAPIKQTGQVVQQVAAAVGKAVSNTGSQAGSVVQQTTSAAAGAVQSVSPPAAGVVKNVGSGAAKALGGVTKTVAGGLAGLGGG
jgi:hypothetical protein